MYSLLWAVPLLPLLAFFVLIFFGKRLGRRASGVVGAGLSAIGAIIMIVTGLQFFFAPPPNSVFTESLGTWVGFPGFQATFGLRLDSLSLVMTLVITFVATLILIYSTEYMEEDGDFHLFFAYMNLFVASMLVLVLADNLLLLFLGWEGVGLCSYLLIGFWYRDPENGRAAQKAFIVTRIGDVFLLVGIFLVYNTFGTLNIQDAMSAAHAKWLIGAAPAVAVALLFLGGAVGKSAQVPLQVWLPDAMAGPTPVSALLHAATMVTAGVYLIARTHMFFQLAPVVMLVVAIIGAVTLLYGGINALAQVDIKRILAFSTVSQIGYMFLGLGVGAWSAAVFHFMTHAFFKALLFLGAGIIIHSLHEEHNIFKMGGLAKKLPMTFWTFLFGAGALSGFPLITAGFYSKDEILFDAFTFPAGSTILWAASALGVLLTGAYIFRLVFHVFAGEAKTEIGHRPGPRMGIAVVVLAALAIIAGFIQLPHDLGNVTVLSRFLERTLPAATAGGGEANEIWLQVVSSLLVFIGIGIAYLLYGGSKRTKTNLAEPASYGGLRKFVFIGLGFDWFYHYLLVEPFFLISRALQHDWITASYDGFGRLNGLFHTLLSRTQSGRIRWYLLGLVVGVVVLLGITVFA